MELFEIAIYLFLGIFFWVCSYHIYKIGNPLDEKKVICHGLYNLGISSLIIFLFVVGLLGILYCIVVTIFFISNTMYNSLTPVLEKSLLSTQIVEYKDCLNVVVQTTLLLGSIIIASSAYLFKKRNIDESKIDDKLNKIIKINPKKE